MGKRLRKARSLCSCISPRTSFVNAPRRIFNWYDEDIWTEIAKCLDGKSLMMLGTSCRWFHRIMSEDCIWKFACLRDLNIPDPGRVAFKWFDLYKKAFDGTHSYSFRQLEKHIDWVRIGAFSLDSDEALLLEDLTSPLRIPKEETIEDMLKANSCCVINNIKPGIWIADLQLVRCPVCDLHSCDGTMQTFDARHIELFLNEGFLDGSWDYDLLGHHEVNKETDVASAGMIDVKHLKDPSTSDILDHKSWAGRRNDWRPKAVVTLHGAAVNTNLQENQGDLGLKITYHAMKAGKDGEVVSVRISQQLL